MNHHLGAAPAGLAGLTLAATLLAAPPSRAAPPPAARDALLLTCLDHINHERYEEVPGCVEQLKRADPDDAAGAFVAATAYQTRMSDYRVRRFEREFELEIAEALAKAQRALERDSSAENAFRVGAAEGYRCVYWFRQGRWLKAVRAALRGMARLNEARRADPLFADPLLGLALYTHAKGKVRLLGLGLFGDHAAETERQLLEAEARARFVSINASYALQYVLVDRGEHARALPVNDRLFADFPRNPVCLYNRALILEALRRPAEAAPLWRRLIDVLYTSGLPSQGFLAECHLHLAQDVRQAGDTAQAQRLLAHAKAHADSRQAAAEIDGPYVGFADTQRAIADTLRSWAQLTAEGR